MKVSLSKIYGVVTHNIRISKVFKRKNIHIIFKKKWFYLFINLFYTFFFINIQIFNILLQITKYYLFFYIITKALKPRFSFILK